LKIARKVLFWCHLAVGVLVASIVIVMSTTGVLLTYQKQMTAWADTRGLDGRSPAPDARRLSADSMVARVRGATGAEPTAVTVRAGADAPVEVALGRDRRVFVNAYTGMVLGEGSPKMRAFFRSVTTWHRYVGAAGDNRAFGRSITGVANLGFFFIVLSGLVLWWPKTWTRARLRNIALFRGRVAGRARDFNWHNTIGVWSFLPLVAVVGSGVVMSYPWANALVYRAVGERPPAAQRPPQAAERGSTPQRDSRPTAPAVASLALDAALDSGAARMPDWKAITIQLPASGVKTMTVALDAGTGGQPQLRASLVLERATGAVARWEPFSSQSPGRRLRSILRFAHTGEVLGITGQTIAGLVTFGSVVLAWTGVALALRRLWAWRRRSTRAAVEARCDAEGELEPAA
jgi:uncharacterized iron-regulated membrane protein